MRYFIILLLLISSLGSFAQLTQADTSKTKNAKAPATTINPVNTNINVGPGVTTTINNNQPLNMGTSNNKPTTGTIIPMKRSKETSKAVNPLGTETLDTRPVVSRSDTTMSKTNKTKTKKRKSKTN